MDARECEQFSDLAAGWLQVLPGGGRLTGFFVCDFTLKEVQSLWAVQALPFRDASHNNEHRHVRLL